MDTTDFQNRLDRHAADIRTLLETLLGDTPRPGEIARPPRLMAAIRHGVLNGGKRLRPFLVLESAALFGADVAAAHHVAAALECVHCYSLVHDDLPAMDDDAMRRGQPTVHIAFDEATAILAGDSLLTFAFELVADSGIVLSDTIRVELVAALARAAGFGGMAGGQALDLDAATTRPGEDGIRTLQAMKTGALIRFACEAGAILGGAPPADRAHMAAFGRAIGLAFQLADDLLDLTADATRLGKATGKDAGAGKATLPALHGIDWTRRELARLVDAAEAALSPYAGRAEHLRAAARFIASREH